MNFLNGINTILISPRRIGKTSLVKKVCETITGTQVKTVYMESHLSAEITGTPRLNSHMPLYID